MEVTTSAGSQGSYEASIADLACSFLHRIEARPRILPYADMVKWVLDNADITDPGGCWWPPTYPIWTPTTVSFSFLVFVIVAQFTIFSIFSGPKLPEPF